jgi:carbonic anhydrase/acetyltransferase-like protein (isoleucine patch superfamily)
MIDPHCIGPDVDRSRISPAATITGASYLTGKRTTVAAGAVIRSSRLHDVAVGENAVIVDTILRAEHPGAHSHRCDAAGRTVVRSPDQPAVGAGSELAGCTLIDSAVGVASRVVNTWAQDTTIGDRCQVRDAKIVISRIGPDATIVGPTEISEAELGHNTRIDRRGYFEGIFSNRFHRLRFDGATEQLKIVETIDLPHVSRYGPNTINSTNSGKLLPRDGASLDGFSEPAGLWQDRLLSHEQIELAPCCWVTPWTKVVGQSPAPHADDEQLVNDELTTCLMPFAMAGFGGDLTRGLVAPGELSVGVGPKQRRGGWVFTYAPGAVIGMVARLHAALGPGRKSVADRVVVWAIETAIAMTRALAHRRGVDLSKPASQQRAGWGRWTAGAIELLQAHLDADLWKFSDGQPVEWRLEANHWTHPRIARLLAAAPDAIEKQKSEEQLFEFVDPVPAMQVAVPAGSLDASTGTPQIDPAATVAPDAIIGPGSRIGPNCRVESGAVVWNSILESSTVGRASCVERSIVTGGDVQAGSVVRSCRIESAVLGAGSNAQCAAIAHSRLAGRTTVSAFADVRNVRAEFPTILGGTFHDSAVPTLLMSMHLAGSAKHLETVPVHVRIGGRTVAVPAAPMLGGGSVIRGEPGKPVRMQGCFVGSNAVIEAGSYLGFGCFVLGRLGPGAGLLPFTISTGPEPAHHQIGAVLGSLASTVITHFVAWTYNAVGVELGDAVAQMTRQSIEAGLAAVEWELARRSNPSSGAPNDPRFADYTSLSGYSPDQLQIGRDQYRSALDSGAWDMAVIAGQLRFTSPKGKWLERAGSAFWQMG